MRYFALGWLRPSSVTSRRALMCSSRAALLSPRTNVETAKARKQRPTGRRAGAFTSMSISSSIAENPSRKRSLPVPLLRVKRLTCPTPPFSDTRFKKRVSTFRGTLSFRGPFFVFARNGDDTREGASWSQRPPAANRAKDEVVRHETLCGSRASVMSQAPASAKQEVSTRAGAFL
jgi:hypothetical protein